MSESALTSESYVIEIAGSAVGIVVREAQARRFAFHAASRRFGRYNGMTFAGPRDAERYLSGQLARRLHSLLEEMVA
ncbi:hypothetical protein [Labrys monachus]|uniref:Uncharacterized protein n=1 Tax=Labrys monachus TaxID=217067 RepID=A0ABU0FHW6_9HYPH|nr:hypothetical protein [Labrys monachus]MDQ0394197.1 hypothetical protein [Labrys monachus]